jgi:hypothetical protein
VNIKNHITDDRMKPGTELALSSVLASIRPGSQRRFLHDIVPIIASTQV